MSAHTKEELENMLEDVVNELDLSSDAIYKHGQLGTCPSVLVRLVLEEKDKKIRMLQARKEAERKADVEHRRKINNEALQSILGVIGNLPDNAEIAKQIVSAIANGEINHVSINY